MVNVNEFTADLSVGKLKTETTHHTIYSVRPDTCRSSTRISLERIHSNQPSSSFDVLPSWLQFIWEDSLAVSTFPRRLLPIDVEPLASYSKFIASKQARKLAL